MVAIANATGLIPDRPGMHGPAAARETLADTLIPKRDGGVLAPQFRHHGNQGVEFGVGGFAHVVSP
jgi:predicted homoserine dehydrogenase-like protein